jgi:hypothetical protein
MKIEKEIDKKTISEVMRFLGSKTSPRKKLSSRANARRPRKKRARKTANSDKTHLLGLVRSKTQKSAQ